ncbi:MAG: hypothetical protein U0168_14070 [Nannocystaceae bacterium]
MPLLVASWSLVGCGPVVIDDERVKGDSSGTTDTGDALDDDDGESSGFAGGTTDPPLLQGEFLLAVSVVIDPTHPLQWHVDVADLRDGDRRTLRFELLALALDIGGTEPGEPLGAPRSATAEVGEDGSFVLSLPQTEVLPMANPISGSQILADVVLQGHVVDETLACGDVTGAITSPLMLDLLGSTFALRRIDAGGLPPLQFACP